MVSRPVTHGTWYTTTVFARKVALQYNMGTSASRNLRAIFLLTVLRLQRKGFWCESQIDPGKTQIYNKNQETKIWQKNTGNFTTKSSAIITARASRRHFSVGRSRKSYMYRKAEAGGRSAPYSGPNTIRAKGIAF